VIGKQNIIEFGKQIISDPILSVQTNPFDVETGTCIYYDNVDRHCLVGHWLHYEMGIEDSNMEIIEGKTADLAIKTLQDCGLLTLSIDKEAIGCLSELQSMADNISNLYDEDSEPYTWGGVIERYIENEANYGF
jgi:hypothetical protein